MMGGAERTRSVMMVIGQGERTRSVMMSSPTGNGKKRTTSTNAVAA